MITFLRGRLVDALPGQVTLEVHGVGYEVLIPLSSFDRLPAPGSEVHLLTHLAVREDAHTLYGFLTPAERDLFRLLIQTVSGIGPKLALNVLGGMSLPVLRAAVAAGDVKALAGIQGVGRKTAERIIVELKDRLAAGPDPGIPAGTAAQGGGDPRAADAALALAALGFKPAEAHEAVRAAIALLGPEAPVDHIVRACLRRAP